MNIQHSFQKSLALFGLLCFFAVPPALAGGSFRFKDIEPLLEQQPALHHYIIETLDVAQSGYALRIGYTVNPELAGKRVAPYQIFAKPKGAKGDWVFRLIIEAEGTFYDEEGNVVALHEGARMEERLVGIRLEPLTEVTAPENGATP